MNEKKTALVMGGTKDKVFAMAVFLLSLKETNGDLTDEIIIFHDGIPERDQKRILKIYPIRFVTYISPFGEMRIDFPSKQRFTDMVFWKYECLRLLEDYHMVIWMDYDMIVHGDLSELCTPVMGGCRFIITENMKNYIKNNFMINDSAINDITVGVHASTFVLYDNLPSYKMMYYWCIDATKKYMRNLHLPEQMIFSLMIKRFNLNVYPLSFQLYSPKPWDRGKVWDIYVKIWHSYGTRKFWTTWDVPEWNSYFKQWEKM